MTRTPGRISIALVAAGMLALSCDAPVYDRQGILRDAVTTVIVPGYEALASAGVDLRASLDPLCTTPPTGGATTTELTNASNAWYRAFLAFSSTSAYSIGPARDMNLADEMGFWPISTTAIERNVAGTDVIDAHYVDALGASNKGLLAIEYLLAGGSSATVLSGLTIGSRRCAYLLALADHVERISAALASAWRPSAGNYAETLTSAGDAGNTAWPDRDSAVVAVFTQLLDALKTVKNTELGIPIGHRSMMPSPLAVESPYADGSIAAMQASVEGASALWGSGEHSFDGWLSTRDPDLAATVRGEFAASDAGFAALQDVSHTSPLLTFSAYCASADHRVGENAYSRVDAVETTIATDVASRLGLSVAFSDMDGD